MVNLLIILVCVSIANVVLSQQRADFVSKQHVSCARSYSKIGCFKTESSPNMKMLINDQDPTSPYNKGYLTDMADFAKSTHSLACRCAAASARGGYTYFSLRFWGQCFVGKDYSDVQKLVDDPKTHKSPDCANPKYQSCNDNHAHECIAWENADYIYSVYGANRNDPNIDGGYSPWSEFTRCSKGCGDGIITRERTCTKPMPKGTGKNCDHLGVSSESKPCKIKECRIDGGWTQWSKFSVCSRSCGGGISNQHRYCKDPRPLNGGAYCAGRDMQTRSCQTAACPVHGVYSQWSAYSPCTATCGVGEKARVRLCNDPAPVHGGRKCDYLGDAEEKTPCNIRKCPIDGGYTSWSRYTRCTKKCGGGTHLRIRICSNPPPSYGGKSCVGVNVHMESCNTDPCPVHGMFSLWGEYNKCSVSCGGGIIYHSRSCTNPSPDHGGNVCVGKIKESKMCNTHECPIDGAYTEWSAFGECSRSCAGGTKERRRTCTNPSPKYGGEKCTGFPTDTSPCNTLHCPIDGGYTKYSSWGICSKSCGGGTQLRSRECTSPRPAYGGDSCIFLGSPIEIRACETQPCARYTKFGKWSTCSKICGGGVQNRTRRCFAPRWKKAVDCSHLGSNIEIRECETQHCPVNGGWNSWTPWTDCSKPCGSGYKSKSRQCNKPEADYGGFGCKGNRKEEMHCNINPCPVNGNWSVYGQYGLCSKTCGGGIQRKVRECANPEPAHGGKECAGSHFSTQPCNTDLCPIDGNWTKWSPWRPCPVTCGGGRIYRGRRCKNPAPENGGERCTGAPIQAKQCGTIPCPINGGWSSYGAYGTCSASCNGGVRRSMRLCENPEPQHEGSPCHGDGSQSKVCNKQKCPIDGTYSAWSEFSRCTHSCGGGTQMRNRKCTSPRYGGRACNVLGHADDSRECNAHFCPVKQYHTAHACQDTKGVLTCEQGNGKIHILDGLFGRTKRWICGNVNFWDYNCRLPHGKGTRIVTKLCEGKQQCTIDASTKTFGDPCKFTHKYLEVMYQCYGGRYPDLADEESE